MLPFETPADATPLKNAVIRQAMGLTGEVPPQCRPFDGGAVP